MGKIPHQRIMILHLRCSLYKQIIIRILWEDVDMMKVISIFPQLLYHFYI
ncbi:hypothetical protein BLGI_3522 [Brevibacillus laterosporus GI-9]|nr:hypothetical protein BLGI_3522 [Brevibacillus laterosporus GI-9]